MSALHPARLLLLSSSLLLTLSCVAADRGDGQMDPDGTGMQKPNPNPNPNPKPQGLGRLSGKVVAPEGTIPIAGALVYLTNNPPAAIPDGVYCDKCVHLPDGTPHTTTQVNGQFQLEAGPGSYQLVVQKGAFRRIRPFTVREGDQAVPLTLTTLPSITDKANGDDIPKIAVVLGGWDPIEVVLAKMGLKATLSKDGTGKVQVLAKDAPAFDIYGLHHPLEMSPHPNANALLSDAKEMGKYHIVFLPCSGSPNTGDPGSGPKCSGVYNPAAKTTLQNFVQAGGRVYASDWYYEYVRQVFPKYITWTGEDKGWGSACQSGGGEQVVTKADTGLADWLAAQSKGLPSVKDAWTHIASVQPQMGPDADGKIVKITPRVWVEASGAPVSASAQHGCGRIFYTTYHTQPTNAVGDPLESQALALLYLILEVSVCIDPIIIG